MTQDAASQASGANYKLQSASDYLRERCLELTARDEVDLRVGMNAVYAYSTSVLADLPNLLADCPEPDCLTCQMKAHDETPEAKMTAHREVAIAQLAIYRSLNDLNAAAEGLEHSPIPEQRALALYCRQWVMACDAMPDDQRFLVLPRPFSTS